MTPAARLTVLEGVLLTLDGNNGGASNAVATARSLLEGAEKPTISVGAPRATAAEVRAMRVQVAAEVDKLREGLFRKSAAEQNPGLAHTVHLFDPTKHQRDPVGKFAAKLGQHLDVRLPDETHVSHPRNFGRNATQWKVTKPDGTTSMHDTAEDAARKALRESAFSDADHPRGRGGKWMPSHHARMETEHFTFDTFGNSEQDARDRMESLWKAHHVQYENPDVASRPPIDDYGVNIEPTGLKGPGHMAECEGHVGYGKTETSAITGARKEARNHGENPEYLKGSENFNVSPAHEDGLRDGEPIHNHRFHKLAEAEVRADMPDTCSLPHAKMAKKGKRICPQCHKPLRIEEAKDSMAKANTPEPFSTSKTSNWVARAGGLPAYIQHIAHALVKKGKTESKAIQMAIGIVKNWAHGHGGVDANTKAAAAKALAQWTAMKAKNAAKKVGKAAKKLTEAELAEVRELEEWFARMEAADPALELTEAELLELAESLLEEAKIEEPVKEPKAKPTDAKGGDSVESVGQRVQHLQHRLTSLGFETTPDGNFGPATAESVKQFQTHALLKPDGIVGPLTAASLRAAPHPDEMAAAEQQLPLDQVAADPAAEAQPAGEAAPEAPDGAALDAPAEKPKREAKAKGSKNTLTMFKGAGVGEKKGDQGVRSVQASLGHMGYDVTTDGRFGPDTEKTIKRFQRKYGLKPDGIVGSKTHRTIRAVEKKHRRLREAVEDRKAALDGADWSRAMARERLIREQLEEGTLTPLELIESSHDDFVKSMMEKGLPEDSAHELAAKHLGGQKRGSSPKSIVALKRLADGKFAPKGAGQVLQKGDHVHIPVKNAAEAEHFGMSSAPDSGHLKMQVHSVKDGEAVLHHKTGSDTTAHTIKLHDGKDFHPTDVLGMPTIDDPNEIGKYLGGGTKGARFKHAGEALEVTGSGDSWVQLKHVASGNTLHANFNEDGGDFAGFTNDKGHPAKPPTAGEASAAHSPLGNSPGRGPSGKMRNFNAMSEVKLKKTIADLTAYGKDPEALAAVKKAAQEKGVAWNEPAPTPSHVPAAPAVAAPGQVPPALAPAPSGEPAPNAPGPPATPQVPPPAAPAPGAPEAAVAPEAAGMQPNSQNHSLKDLPMGTTFEMNDGKAFTLHKPVNDPFYIVKDEGGKGKPLHKMFAPPKIGPVAAGYEGAPGGASPSATGHPVSGNAGGEDELFNQLSKSVAVAQGAKAQGADPAAALKAAGAPAAPAAPAAPSPTAEALKAYKAAGGKDPKVIAALQAAA